MSTEQPSGQKDVFTSIGDGVYLRVPQTNTQSEIHDAKDEKAPNVILIFGWMGAQLPHLFKYTDVYRTMYPHATQILVRSYPSFFWSLERTRRKRLEPVVEVLEALGCIPPRDSTGPTMKPVSARTVSATPHPKILTHAFSNGGSYNLITLSALLTSSTPTSIPTLPSALVLDSCPDSSGGYHATIRAFTVSIKSRLLYYPVALLALLLHFSSRLFVRKTPPLTHLARTLQKGDVAPWMDPARTPRLYIYSKSDAMVPWRDVVRHADEAEGRGLVVRREEFVGTRHVAHARNDPERYWGAVRRLWEADVEVGSTKAR